MLKVSALFTMALHRALHIVGIQQMSDEGRQAGRKEGRKEGREGRKKGGRKGGRKEGRAASGAVMQEY